MAFVLFEYVNVSLSMANLTLTNSRGVVIVRALTPAQAPQRKRLIFCLKEPSFL